MAVCAPNNGVLASAAIPKKEGFHANKPTTQNISAAKASKVSGQTFELIVQKGQKTDQKLFIHNVKRLVDGMRIHIGYMEDGSLVVIKPRRLQDSDIELQNMKKFRGIRGCLQAIGGVYRCPQLESKVILTPYSGRDLLLVSKKKCLKVAQIRLIAKSTLETLSEIHKLGWIHGDIKPENIFIPSMPCVGKEPKVIVGDFDQPTEIDERPSFVGTPRFAALEHEMQTKVKNGGRDLWSYALALYTAFTQENFGRFGAVLHHFFKTKNEEAEKCLKGLKYNLIQEGDFELIRDFEQELENLEKDLKDRKIYDSKKSVISLFISLHEYQEAFGEVIPSETIKSIWEDIQEEFKNGDQNNAKRRLAVFDFLFEKDGNTEVYNLKKLNFTLPKLGVWEKIILKKGKERGDNSSELKLFISFIKDLCSYKSEGPKTAEEFLSHPFFTNIFQFNLKFNHCNRFLNTNSKLKIVEVGNEENCLEISLKNAEKVLDSKYQLTKGAKFAVFLEISPSRSLFGKNKLVERSQLICLINGISLTEGATLTL